jgi:orotidine-5'-phosphate decarboxylase
MTVPSRAPQMNTDPKVIVALDFGEPAQAMALVDRLRPSQCALKIGKELFVAGGPEPVRRVIGRGFRVFLDLKFHDIPHTVGQACAAATQLGAWMLNVHASGGRSMLLAAREAVDRAAVDAPRPLLLAVTVLTSLGRDDLDQLGFAISAEALTLKLARLAVDCGLDGVVCSAAEAPALRKLLGDRVKLVTPGIRPRSESADDQARIATPEAAIANGADYLVIGRPITRAPDPIVALDRINAALGVRT